MNENEENKKAEISEISGKTRKDRGKKDFLNFLNQLTFKLFQTAGYSRRMLRFVSCSLLTTENALSLSSPPRLYSKLQHRLQNYTSIENRYTKMALDFRPLVSNIFLFFLIFGMSATVDFSHFKTQIKNTRAIATGLVLQFIVLPFIGFLIVKFGKLDQVMGITLLIITSSPGGAYSNWFCS